MTRSACACAVLALTVACGGPEPAGGDAAEAIDAGGRSYDAADVPALDASAPDAGPVGDSDAAYDAGAPDAGPPDAGSPPSCGDGTCDDDETCADCAADCGACPACGTEGGRSCAGGSLPGRPTMLYVCRSGRWTPDHACAAACEAMPAGVPDRCPEDVTVPASLVRALSGTPYVEDACAPATFAGWPYDALRCTYSAGGLTATVTVADPPPERVARWIADASTFIPVLWSLKWSSPADYERGVAAVAAHTIGESSRIFPLQGGILEDMDGTGMVNYQFQDGVTTTCSSGCYCRLNSLHRTEWCAYQAFLGGPSSADCLAALGSASWTAAWGGQCLGNHADAWLADENAHYRAKAWLKNQAVRTACPSYAACTAAQVVAAVQAAYSTR